MLINLSRTTLTLLWHIIRNLEKSYLPCCLTQADCPARSIT